MTLSVFCLESAIHVTLLEEHICFNYALTMIAMSPTVVVHPSVVDAMGNRYKANDSGQWALIVVALL